MKVSTKLYASVGALLAIGILVAGLGMWYLRTLNGELDVALNKTAVRIDKVDSMSARVWQMVASMRGVFTFASAGDAERTDKSLKEYQVAEKRLKELIGELRPLLVTEEGRKLLSTFETELSAFERPAAEYMRLSGESKFKEAVPYAQTIFAYASTTDETLREFRTQQLELLKRSAERAQSLRAQSLLLNLLFSCLLLAIGTVAVVVVRDISRTLVTAIAELSESAEQMAGAAGQVSSSAQSLAQGSSEQAASIEETSASSEEINSMARKNTENSRAAAELVTQSQQRFSETNRSLDQMVTAMGEINTSSDKISKIIKVIDEIAFQTNILALNAAVEAARAGEAGMGFAVVADEVRNLAQRCAQAAKDTAALIEESISKSNDGKAKVDQVAVAIRAISEESGKVKTLVDEVNLGSQEQARGIDQIGKAISQMEQVTQKTAANAEESAAAAEELNAQSEALRDVVGRLTAMVGGGEEVRRAGPVRKKTVRVHHSPGLPRLSAAVTHKHAESVPAGKHAIPLDEEFKEF
jgi:methyl-accepting chemotaxis protein/methyl-accepting chemotaxis protein-1 (serine sensor receptor)